MVSVVVSANKFPIVFNENSNTKSQIATFTMENETFKATYLAFKAMTIDITKIVTIDIISKDFTWLKSSNFPPQTMLNGITCAKTNA